MKPWLAAALMGFGLAVPDAAQSAALTVGSIVDQIGAPLAGVRVTMAEVRVAESQFTGICRAGCWSTTRKFDGSEAQGGLMR